MQRITLTPNQKWRNRKGKTVKLMATSDGYAMLRRRKKKPFCISIGKLVRDYEVVL